MQEDLLQPLITVREAMAMAADLKLGSDMTAHRKAVIVSVDFDKLETKAFVCIIEI
ncbi:hypothetical protein RR48_00598 [Papilio machaon]|uniref:Uncharacterized protein n=1 Tax=Papilio machaon TaxID=76193 RepID=A0A0N1IJY0_PAPMA|nr:hypothetical protein RR48_00598 [Papilio machaon]